MPMNRSEERNQCPHCGYWKLVGERCKCEAVGSDRYCPACDIQYVQKNCPMCSRTEEESWVRVREIEEKAMELAEKSALRGQVSGTHYKDMAIQPAEYTTKNGIGHLAGDAIAYISRYRAKNGKEDLQKAIHSIQLLIELEYGA